MDKKGFLFTVTVFLVLVYILLSISVWVKSIEASERSFSEFYKESTVELTIEQITPLKMDNVTRIIMKRALLRLNDHTIEHSVIEGPVSDENRNTRSALFELLVNGSADGGYFKGGVGVGEERNSSLKGWADNLNASLNAIGIYVNEFQVSRFAMGQSGIDRVNYTFEVDLGLKDYSNTSAVSRTYHVSNYIDITGLVDPALARESMDDAGDNQTVYRMFFFNKDLYPNSTEISVDRLSQPVTAGQDWVYGPLAMANGSADLVPNANLLPPITGNQRTYILVGTFEEIEQLTPSVYKNFAGFIVTSEPVLTPTDCGESETHYNEEGTFNPLKYSEPTCQVSFDESKGALTSKPFIVAPGFDPTEAPECPLLDDSGQHRRCVLMLNQYLYKEVSDQKSRKLSTSGAGLFDVEIVRDFVMCGYYTHNPKAPSYLQRLLNGSYSRNSSEFGIETFVIGNYANDPDVYGTLDDVSSRLDRELFSGVEGIKVRGLPGCKDYPSCSDKPMTGIFAVSADSKDDYGLEDIACDNGAAGCDS